MTPTGLPTGRPGRLLALLIAVALLLVLWFGAASPLIALYQARAATLDQRQALAARMASLVEMLPSLRARAAATGQAGPAVTAIAGTSDAVAAATLQNLVQDMATEAGANLQSVEIVQAQPAGEYRRIGLKLSLGTPWTVLIRLMHSIGTSTPPVLIDDLEVHAAPGVPGLGREATLQATLTVYGFRARGDDGPG